MFVLFVLIALAIVIDSPGSPLFIQDRIGKQGRRFRMYKFRTMRYNHDDSHDRVFMQAFVTGQLHQSAPNNNSAVFKAAKKGDITRLGRYLRKTSLDELPQLINVLKGEMSIIGPRPNVPWEVEKYLDWHYERLNVLPGITGLAQVYGRSNINFDRIVRYDIEYTRKLSLSMDLWILWRTAVTVFTGHGAS